MRKYSKYSRLCFSDTCEIRKVQTELLQNHLADVLRSSQFYKKLFADFDTKNITPDTLRTLPTTTKSDIEQNFDQFLICRKDEIAEIVRTSGTSGKSAKIVYTADDLKRLKYNEQQALTCCGLKETDTVLLTCTMDRCFIAGLAYFLGCRALGAATIRNGANTLKSHIEIIREMKPNVIIGVPSFLAKLAEFAAEKAEADSLGIEKLVCIGEPLRTWENGKLVNTPLCTRLEELWQADAYSTYASTEMVTAFCECSAKNGGHLIPELAVVEILDDDGLPVAPGETGEVTITPFHFSAMPLVRYRTGDMAVLIEEPCACGRNSVRISGISGRKHQMIKYRGTSFYPTAVNVVLEGFESVRTYQITVKHNGLSDDITVLLALSDSSEMEKISTALQAALRVKLPLKVQEYSELNKAVHPPGSRKPVRLKIEN